MMGGIAAGVMLARRRPTVEDYEAAFETERKHTYPVIDQFEARMGYALARERYEPAARVLACPVKAHSPNWQHGRVLYAAARKYFSGRRYELFNVLDVGTAKGYSALCLLWALIDVRSDVDVVDARLYGRVTSVDVIDPIVRAVRNTVAEVDGLKTLEETLEPWPESGMIAFVKSTGLQWLADDPARVHVAFIDGKHSGPVVQAEGELLTVRQEPGDLAIFDDVQIPGVADAVRKLSAQYTFERIDVLPNRAYAIGTRK